ncbi:hypothetical protein VVD49_16125 [Uliginosibacterium sp. H3]|uniref:NnrS family protein n=1 Tax=Uliginosibacterium silvisoli TaxID=3114758 RepID=A0ABU6K5S1_9RHOO|nr:hypothetical protein [Uliginosibacterium sp. H3]
MRSATAPSHAAPAPAAVSGPLRVALVLPAVAALACGVLSGLLRLGLPLPVALAQFIGGLIAAHGALMVGGFFGTLIGLERAVAIGARWAYLAPLLSGLSVIAMLGGAPAVVAPLLMSGAALVMLIACSSVWLRQRVAHHMALVVAALAWLLGNAIWGVTGSVLPAVPLWIAFLVLTIAAERLELSRFVPTPRVARIVFGFIVAALTAAAITVSLATPFGAVSAAGLQVFAAALGALSLWLLRYDIARRTIRSSGLTRYMAICLLSGYVWLAVGALAGLFGALQPGHVLRDAALHAVLLGFVFAMVFGHAPVIVPAITRIGFNWHRGFYLPLFVLHVTLAARVLAGVCNWLALRQWAAMGNALVLLLFFAMAVGSLLAARKPSTPT